MTPRKPSSDRPVSRARAIMRLEVEGVMDRGLHLTYRLRNNILLQLRRAGGLSQRELSKRAGFCTADYSRLESLRASPHMKNGEWRGSAKKLARFWKVAEDMLFPPVVEQVHTPVVERELSTGDVETFLGEGSERLALPPDQLVEKRELQDALAERLGTLSHREEAMVRAVVCEGKTLLEAGKILDVGGERVRQIVAKALRKLRHPSRSRKLREHIDGRVRKDGDMW